MRIPSLQLHQHSQHQFALLRLRRYPLLLERPDLYPNSLLTMIDSRLHRPLLHVLRAPPGRQQRSLNDLRGIRSMGRRQDTHRGYQTGEEEEEEVIDVPPFMKKFD